jgi:hypothetical protein
MRESGPLGPMRYQDGARWWTRPKTSPWEISCSSPPTARRPSSAYSSSGWSGGTDGRHPQAHRSSWAGSGSPTSLCCWRRVQRGAGSRPADRIGQSSGRGALPRAPRQPQAGQAAELGDRGPSPPESAPVRRPGAPVPAASAALHRDIARVRQSNPPVRHARPPVPAPAPALGHATLVPQARGNRAEGHGDHQRDRHPGDHDLRWKRQGEGRHGSRATLSLHQTCGKRRHGSCKR